MRFVLRFLVVAAFMSGALAGAASPAKVLQIFFIDVEGGQSTLIVTPAGESMLIDAGYGPRGGREGRDAARILEVVKEAGIERIDYLLVTHFHPDHAGGIPELAAKIPIGTFVDYGQPLGTDRMASGSFRNYEPVRGDHPHIQPQPGDRLPLQGIEVNVVSAGGALLPHAMPGAGQANSACADTEDHPEDGTENYRSIGVVLQFGRFRFLDLGDLSGNTLTRLACPKDLIGQLSVYLIAHHGDYDTNVPALYAALRPRVAIMNNGVTRGGSPDAFRTLAGLPWLEDLWQLHESRNPGARNAADSFIANVDDGSTSYWIKLTAKDDGSFRIANGRNGYVKDYGAVPVHDSANLNPPAALDSKPR